MAPFFSLLIRRAWQLLAAGLLAAGALPAHAQDSTLTRLIRQNRYPLVASGAQLSGAGWDKIRASVQQSQFVLVGEDHGTAQIPLFAAAVAQVLKPAVYVAEIDPYVAQALTGLVAQPGPPTAYLRQYPGALAFDNLSEEFELVRQLRAQQVRLLGLDQVFATTAAPVYRQLAGLVKNKTTQRYLQRRAAAYQAHDQATAQQGSFGYSLLTQSQATIDSLLTLTQAESPAAQQVAKDYAMSYRIYKTQDHQLRVNFMKRQLRRAFQAYQPSTQQPVPKMLFKFGAYHLGRGLSLVPDGNCYDVGSLVQNLADTYDQQSLHLYIGGKQGAQAAGLGRGISTYTATHNELLRPFYAEVAGPNWVVFDLRPLRQALVENQLLLTDEKLRRLITGYDYVIVIPETTASHAI